MPKFGTKYALFAYFWARILKTIVIFKISSLKVVNNESLTHTVDFGVRFTFSKGPRSTFSEGTYPGPGPGQLYKYVINEVNQEKF